MLLPLPRRAGPSCCTRLGPGRTRPCAAGLLASMRVGSTSARLTTSFAWYNSSDGLDSHENPGQASGAYIFRRGTLGLVAHAGQHGSRAGNLSY